MLPRVCNYAALGLRFYDYRTQVVVNDVGLYDVQSPSTSLQEVMTAHVGAIADSLPKGNPAYQVL